MLARCTWATAYDMWLAKRCAMYLSIVRVCRYADEPLESQKHLNDFNELSCVRLVESATCVRLREVTVSASCFDVCGAVGQPSVKLKKCSAIFRVASLRWAPMFGILTPESVSYAIIDASHMFESERRIVFSRYKNYFAHDVWDCRLFLIKAAHAWFAPKLSQWKMIRCWKKFSFHTSTARRIGTSSMYSMEISFQTASLAIET